MTTTIDRTKWGSGPWDDEPDRVEFRAHGLACLMKRNHHGVWCGYAGVPPGHPLHGKHYGDECMGDIDAHGGLTYASECDGSICHVPEPGESEHVWWFGFDCAHGGDLVPGMKCVRDLIPDWMPSVAMRETYRPASYARAETERLAQQLAAITGGTRGT